MFNFRIIDTQDGNQVIDTRLKTPYDSLTPLQMEEYIEVDVQLDYMDRMKRKVRREAKQRKMSNNLIYKIACFCGLM